MADNDSLHAVDVGGVYVLDTPFDAMNDQMYAVFQKALWTCATEYSFVARVYVAAKPETRRLALVWGGAGA